MYLTFKIQIEQFEKLNSCCTTSYTILMSMIPYICCFTMTHFMCSGAAIAKANVSAERCPRPIGTVTNPWSDNSLSVSVDRGAVRALVPNPEQVVL